MIIQTAPTGQPRLAIMMYEHTALSRQFARAFAPRKRRGAAVGLIRAAGDARGHCRAASRARSAAALRTPPVAGHPRRRPHLLFRDAAGRSGNGERRHGTLTSEAHVILGNLKLLLESAGSSLDRLVQVHALIYDSIEYDVLNRVYRQYVANGPPARTVWTAQIEAGFKIQLDVVAAA